MARVGFEPPTFRSCGQRSVHYATEAPPIPDVLRVKVVTKKGGSSFPLTRHTYRTNKITLNITTRCHHCTLRVTLDTTTKVFTSPLPTDHLPLFADQYTSHSSPTISTLHLANLRQPLVHLGVQVSDNIRRDVIIPIF